VSLVWTDPPYNVAYEGKAGTIQNDNMSPERFRAFLVEAFRACDSVMPPGAVFSLAHADKAAVRAGAAVLTSDVY
jgi:DNA modification methylase